MYAIRTWTGGQISDWAELISVELCPVWLDSYNNIHELKGRPCEAVQECMIACRGKDQSLT